MAQSCVACCQPIGDNDEAFCGRCYDGHPCYQTRIATLVEAAHLLCCHCEDGEYPIFVSRPADDMSTEPHGVVHEVRSPSGFRNLECYAHPIIARLFEEWS